MEAPTSGSRTGVKFHAMTWKLVYVQSFDRRIWVSMQCISNMSSTSCCSQTGYPDKFLHGKGFSIEGSSNCLWCPENGPQNCGLHRQSPIDLQRNRGIAGDPMEKECPDWHWMQFRNDTCSFDDDLIDQFVIERHALKLNIPINEDGEIDCEDDAGLRQFARLDYSKGFPDWWWLEHTSIQVPSQHTQEGKRYDAEVTLAHFYEIDHPKNQVCQIFLFLAFVSWDTRHDAVAQQVLLCLFSPAG